MNKNKLVEKAIKFILEYEVFNNEDPGLKFNMNLALGCAKKRV